MPEEASGGTFDLANLIAIWMPAALRHRGD